MSTRILNERLVVSTDGVAGPYITVTSDQLEPVQQALNAQTVPFQVDEDAVLLAGRSALRVINLGGGADVRRVQELLDRLNADLVSRPPSRQRFATTQQGLIVKGAPPEIQELLRRIEAGPVGGWSRRGDIEDRLRKARASEPPTWCFSKAVAPVGREVTAWLSARGPRELSVSTVLPLHELEALGPEQFDQALADFRDTLIAPLTNGLTTRVLMYRTVSETTLEETLSFEAMSRLHSFSEAADRTSLQPLDWRRWDLFLVRSHLDDTVVPLDLLGTWLEDEGWPVEQRRRLVSDYERGRRLLSVYDEERAAR
jgi:hypothetical protein